MRPDDGETPWEAVIHQHGLRPEDIAALFDFCLERNIDPRVSTVDLLEAMHDAWVKAGNQG